METVEDKIQQEISHKIVSKYYCKHCDYGTSKKCNYDTHIISIKHCKNTDDYNIGQNQANTQPLLSHSSTKEKFMCSCGKEYKHRQGLWKHSKNCNTNEKTIENSNQKDEISDKELIMILIKDNYELKNMMMKVIEKVTKEITI